MSKQVVSVDGEDVLVREDTAKSFRGVHWALLSLAAFILIMALLFFGGFLKMLSSETPVKSPAEVERQSTH